MLFKSASNSVFAKARAMYGKRLSSQNYSELMSCHSVPEIASYLKHRTDYSSVLGEINENDVHRGQLEMVLKKKIFIDFSSLGMYDISVKEHFSDYIISRMEIEQIMHILMLLSANKTTEYIHSVPTFLENHTKVDLNSFSKLQDYSDFLNAVSHSKYYKILKPFAPIKGKEIDLTGIETALYTYLYKNLFSIIDKSGKSAKRELYNMFNCYIDYTNFVRILRLKKYYNYSSAQIREALFHFGSLKRNVLENMINAESIEEVFNIMKSTPAGRKLSSIDYNYPDELPRKFRFLSCVHYIRFSANPSVVMMSYIFLAEIELHNIVNIIEGIRYNLPTNEINKMLIYTD